MLVCVRPRICAEKARIRMKEIKDSQDFAESLCFFAWTYLRESAFIRG